MLLMSFLPFLAVIMRGHRTVKERSEYSMTVLSTESASEGIKVDIVILFFIGIKN